MLTLCIHSTCMHQQHNSLALSGPLSSYLTQFASRASVCCGARPVTRTAAGSCDVAPPKHPQSRCLRPVPLLLACCTVETAAAVTQRFASLVQLSSVPGTERYSLTEAQQRCLSAKRRDLSDHAQHIAPGSADVQQPQHSRTEEADPQFGAAAGAEPPQGAKVH